MIKINLINSLEWPEHRSGWGYVLSLLKNYSDLNGLNLDGCLDSTFGYRAFTGKQNFQIPFEDKWAGFLHHPIEICPWYDQNNLSANYIINSSYFQESLIHCQCIFTLSEYLATYVRNSLNNSISVYSIVHPTEKVDMLFDIDKFKKEKKVVQIGMWMRKLTSFFKLRAIDYVKIYPINNQSIKYLKEEMLHYKNLTLSELNSVKLVERLDHYNYDILLSESIVFLDLYDTSANNAIIECIARTTPIVVNKHPAVVEYLGDEYPLYYREICEAEELLQDQNAIEKAHLYLKNKILQDSVLGEHFINSFFKNLIM